MSHYMRMIHGKPLIPIKPRTRKIKYCSEENCNNKHYVKGLCKNHYTTKIRDTKLLIGGDSIKFGKVCLADKCNRKIKKTIDRDYCFKHIIIKNKELIGEEIKGVNHWSWKGGKSAYKDHSLMKRNRKIKLRQSNNSCEDCGISSDKKTLHVHHLDQSKDNHLLENLKIVCPKCHGIYHKGQRGRKRKIN